MTNEARMGRPLAMAWKLVPKSMAHAEAAVFPSLSEITLAVKPAEKRSLKFCARVTPTKV